MKYSYIHSQNHGFIPTSKNPRNALVPFFSEHDSPTFLNLVNFLLTSLFKETRGVSLKPLEAVRNWSIRLFLDADNPNN